MEVTSRNGSNKIIPKVRWWGVPREPPRPPPDFAPAVLQGRSKGPGQYNAHAFFIHNDQQVNGLTSDKK